MTTTRVAASDGFPLQVQMTGRGDGPPLLLLPGQANSHRWWTGLRDDFADFRVITFDYRGTGDSRGPVGEWSSSSFARDAAEVLAALDVGSVSVYATSMGGRVAQMLAAERPHLVDRLVLACTSSGGRHAHERDTDVRRALADPDPNTRLRALRRLFYTDAWTHGTAESHLFGDPTMEPDESRAHLRASARHDAWNMLPWIEAPTLVIHGSDDLMVPAANADLLAERIPRATFRLHHGGRHGFFDEFRREVTPWVRSWLRDSGGA
jgi:pimeloyl-ACP methyl ester carboxylesterase